MTVVIIGSVLPASPLTHLLGLRPLPTAFFAAPVGLVIGYLALIGATPRIAG